MTNAALGLLILILAGIMNASFTLPMKYTCRWAWENTWIAWSILALVILPPVIAISTVPHLQQIYSSASPGILVTVILFGAGWGVAQVFFGLAVDAIGIALTFSLVLGTSAAVGTLIPLIRLHPERLQTSAGYGVLSGVVLVIAGVLVCAVAGRKREKALHMQAESNKSSTLGIALAILCGFGASFINLGLAFGSPLSEAAQRAGASDLNAPNAVWMLVMLSGSVPNLLYCLWLLRRNHTGGNFAHGRVGHWALAFVMAVLWLGSTLLYGVSASKLGSGGVVVGWPLFMSLIVITASFLGMVTGEWKNSGRLPIKIQWSGVALLVLAVFVLAGASRHFS
jgi:L-rhamnose-H+ transport protein